MLTQEHLSYLALLTKLSPEAKNIADFTIQYTAILNYLNILSNIDTNNVEPLYTPIEKTKPLRLDIAKPHNNPKDLLKNAPEKNETFFIVPCIL